MIALTAQTALINFLGSYGPEWRTGVVVDHVEMFVAAGGTVRPAASGSGASWAVVDGIAYPVVCGELVAIRTEDGVTDGRCGSPATVDGCCAGHAEIVASYADVAVDREYDGRPSIWV